MGWIQTLQKGEIAEDAVMRLFQSEGFVVYKPDTFHGVDLLVQSGDEVLKLEIKNDVSWSKTGNIAIEFYNPRKKKPSGISASDADFWVFYLSSAIWIIPREKLLSYIQSHPPLKTVSYAGDGNASVYLYKSADILPEFRRIDRPASNYSIKLALTKSSY